MVTVYGTTAAKKATRRPPHLGLDRRNRHLRRRRRDIRPICGHLWQEGGCRF